MPSSNLLALIDDIATVLDDISLMTQVAAKKTAGVLGDDLALNAEQVSGVRAERELPIIWAVAKGSLKNKLILVPAALALSTFLPILITPLLMLGGAYLCYEGFEKVAHKLLHSDSQERVHREDLLKAFQESEVNLAEFEKQKIKGAIRTDFVLSAEIIVITLGTVVDANFVAQLTVVSVIALVMTIGVYGLVAVIVKIDDAGFYLIKDHANTAKAKVKRSVGRGLLSFAPKLMKSLSFVGTIAMFLVGGGILLHGIPGAHHVVQHAEEMVHSIAIVGNVLASITSSVLGMLCGVLAGAVVLLLTSTVARLTGKHSD